MFDMTEDNNIRDAFYRLLPHYFELSVYLPAEVKLILFLNNWANVPAACIDLTKLPRNKRIACEMCRALTHMQTFGHYND